MIRPVQAVAFKGFRAIASGPLEAVAGAVKALMDAGEAEPIVIFDAVSGHVVDVDFSGGVEAVRGRLADPLGQEPNTPEEERTRGRPKLGVVAREVTLLPRHWDWLATQRGGASAALRRLVDEARRRSEAADALREGQAALYRFITAMAGDAEGYEEATRALFAGEEGRFETLSLSWPVDVRAQALAMAGAAFGHAPSPLDKLVFPDRRSAVRRALEAAFPGETMDAAEPMAWGASGAGVFKLTVAGRPAVLRLERPPNGFGDPARQYACARIAAEAGVAPPLLHADAEAGVSVSGFVDAASASPMLFDAAHLKAVAGLVRRLHDAPLFPRYLPYLDALDGLMAQFRRSGAASPKGLEAPLSLYARLTALYPRHDSDLVSSHNDLNPSNIIFEGGRPFIVDWEAAAAGDRYADIAALANWFAADQAGEDLILTTYFDGPPGDELRARFEVMRQINRLFFGVILIGAAMAQKPGPQLEAEDFRRERFSDIRGEMRALATAEGRLRFGCAFIAEALHTAG